MSVSERREKEREARRNLILDSAQAAFLERGFDAATMGEVAEHAQLSKGTLYNYFNTKEELLAGVVARHQQRLISRFEKVVAQELTGLEHVRQLMLVFVDHMSDNPGRLRMMLSRWASGQSIEPSTRCGGLFHQNIRRIMELFRNAIVRGQRDGSVRVSCDPINVTMHLWAALLGSMMQHLQLAALANNPFMQLVPSHEQAIDFFVQALEPHAHDSLVHKTTTSDSRAEAAGPTRYPTRDGAPLTNAEAAGGQP